MTAILQADIGSVTKRDTVYGKKGEMVTIVTKDHEPVWIVENSKGVRFPVLNDEHKVKEV